MTGRRRHTRLGAAAVLLTALFAAAVVGPGLYLMAGSGFPPSADAGFALMTGIPALLAGVWALVAPSSGRFVLGVTMLLMLLWLTFMGVLSAYVIVPVAVVALLLSDTRTHQRPATA